MLGLIVHVIYVYIYNTHDYCVLNMRSIMFLCMSSCVHVYALKYIRQLID